MISVGVSPKLKKITAYGILDIVPQIAILKIPYETPKLVCIFP